MTTKVLVTGAAGFSGIHLVRRLKQDSAVFVAGLSRGMPDINGRPLWDAYHVADVTDNRAVDHVLERLRPDRVFHLAGSTVGSHEQIARANLRGTSNLLQSIRTYSPEAAVLLVGSAAEYGAPHPHDLPLTEEHPCKPTTPYGIAKHEATRLGLEYAERFGARVTVARPFNIVGAGVPSFTVVGAFIERVRRAVANGEMVVKVGNVDTERDFVAVNDVVDGYVRMMDAEAWGSVMNLCSGIPRTIASVVGHLAERHAPGLSIQVDPLLVRAGDIPVSYGSWLKAHTVCGFTPATPFEAALDDAWCASGEPHG